MDGLGLAAGVSSGPLALGQHGAGLFAGGAVDVVVAEEYLRCGSAGGTVLGHVVGTDVDGGCGGFLNELDAGGLAMGTGDTVGLAFGCFDDQEDTAVVGEGLVEFEGEGVTLAHDGGGGGVLYAQEGGRYENRLAAAGDDSVVQAGEQVGAGDLGAGAEDTAALLGEGQLVPGKDVVVREGLPHSGKPLEDALYLGLVGSADGVRCNTELRTCKYLLLTVQLLGCISGRWGINQHGELAVVEQAQRAEQLTADRDRISLYLRGGRQQVCGRLARPQSCSEGWH